MIDTIKDIILWCLNKNEFADRYLEEMENDYKSPNIQNVLNYLLGDSSDLPNRNDREMFLKFFERLQHKIENTYFQKEKYKREIFDRFAHYAIKASEDERFMTGLKSDARYDCWKSFNDFIIEMKKLQHG